MSERIKIINFGPIEEVDIEIKKLTVFIGPQAGGKSTVAKLVFLFKSLKGILTKPYFEYIDKWANEKNASFSYDQDKLIKYINGEIKNKFNRIFGNETSKQDFKIEYTYNNQQIFQFVKKPYGEELIVPSGFKALLSGLDQFISNDLDKITVPKSMTENAKNSTTLEKYIKTSTAKFTVSNLVESYFTEVFTPVFIPAGRGAFSILSDQIGILGQDQVDDLLISFLRTIKSLIKNINSFSDFLEHLNPFISDSSNLESALKNSFDIADRILRGKYAYADGESRIYTSEDEYVKLNFASSGQQEAIWIIFICLDLISSGASNNFVVVEEPEAHLYPNAQFEMVKLIANLLNLPERNNQVIITTHSPYILSSLNCLLMAGMTSELQSIKVEEMISKEYWLNSEMSNAYKIDRKSRSIIDEELSIIRIDEIDEISETINEIQNKLIQIIYEP